ncbi:hypothetical protein [Lactococcus garvieae]|uniref:hypothetical protein n=1 Tax=Lactococcus garvieae TaxID=1363 RepID=UPI00385254CD
MEREVFDDLWDKADREYRSQGNNSFTFRHHLFAVLDDELKVQPKLSIPKKIAELLDIAIEGLTKFEDFLWAVDEFDVLIPNDKVEYFRNWTNEEPNAHALAVAYVTGKALGVELVEVEG